MVAASIDEAYVGFDRAYHLTSKDMKKAQSRPFRIALVGTYKPRRCGIATFTAALAAELGALPDTEVRIVSIGIPEETSKFQNKVIYEIQKDEVETYFGAASVLNSGGFDIVCLQHEYGLFGGECGSYILEFLRELIVPCVTTAHTILSNPNELQLQVLKQVCALSKRTVTISDRGAIFLKSIYQLPEECVFKIPHGVPVRPTQKRRENFNDSQLLLTYGILSAGKGAEYVIEALPIIIREKPNTHYIIAGCTHPNVKRLEGESYRGLLRDRVTVLGLEDRVTFRDEFLSDAKLDILIARASICVMPYINREQISSGTIALAASASKSIVSTRSWYAEEILGQGRGILVPFRDPSAIAKAIIDLLSDPEKKRMMEKRIGQFAEEMIWQRVAHQYHREFQKVHRVHDLLSS
jgi:glycosyltransferase involved in cell wall biosynthesis